jgi:predicted lipid-binding transport protein (Tim44 family)
MWGSWYTILFGGLLAVLLAVALAFGTSALFFGFLIAGGIIAAIAVLYVLNTAARRQESAPDPVAHAAPAHGEGSEPARS